ncbi:Ig-like domain repeat protein [Rhizobacter sp. J219]|uniref:Ig-like domain repeat protein n=1 Tax=Rhizobacter sp. J219 TaxID=2898430 RepID=UPI00215152AE|nr:Ig-like domain repeat protein [Rhizobacter sp. J219]MCR5881404.1 Ig-like domain repeat protein [Rhizobacter sp. J219]
MNVNLNLGRVLATTALALGGLLGSAIAFAQTATTTVLTSATNPQVVGQSSVLTATVTPAAATGTVTFRDGSTTIGTGTLSGGVATFTRTFPTAGNRSLTAIYSGGGGYTTSTSATLTQTVSKAASTTTLVSSANPATAGSITLTATVVGFGTPTGTITFRNGTASLGTATLASGSASLTVTTLGIGTHNLTAAYGGNTNNATSTSTVLAQTINGAALPPAPVASAPVVNYEYDAQGNPTKTVQAPGQTGFGFETRASYDPLSRVKDTTDPKNGITRFQYDGGDRLTQVTDPRQLVTQYPRNGLGDATSLVSPDTGTATHTYDEAGNLKTRTDSRGVLTTNTYDALNRLTRSVYSRTGLTTQTYVWNYDQTGTGYANGIGRLTSTTHPSGSTQYTYDAQGRLLTDIQRVTAATGANTSTITRTVTYTYDTAGNIATILYPSGRKLTLTYTDGQLTSMGLGANATATPVNLISNISFEPFGGPKSWNWQLGSSTQAYERSYDGSGRLIRYRLGNSVRDIGYDAADRITSYTHYDAITAAPQPSLNQSFGYDENGRLTTITTATASWTIGYDANGNRTGVTLNGTPSVYATATTSNRLNSITNPARSFGYDEAGNTTSDSTNYTATYDAAGRLATLTKAGTTTTYSYNGLGQRVRKFSSTGATSTNIFVYDQQGQLLGEYTTTGTAIREYVWLGNTPVAMFTPPPSGSTPVVYYFQTDHLNTPRVVIDTAGNVRWRWLAEPFGTTAPEDNPSNLGAITQPLRFPGQYADSESGLFYNYFRDYDSTTGRYAQSDPIGLAGGINTYAYVASNPLLYIDPDGRFSTLGGVLVIGGVIYGGYKIYDKFEQFNRENEACKRMCESTVACGDPERTAMYQANAARCIATCKANAHITTFFGVGRGPTGPKSPLTTPDYFPKTPPAIGKP